MPTQVFDFDKALHDALAVYYFPAMDDWDRAIVRPLALQGFHRSMRQDRGIYEKSASLTAEQEREWQAQSELGETLLKHYFQWAATVDEFASIFSDHDVWTHIPEPGNPDHALAMPDGRPIRYLGRVDQVISDPSDEYWVVDHRVIRDGWEDADELLLDMVTLSYAWALELCYPQLKVAGTIYNELRTDVPNGGAKTVQAELDERDRRDMSRARHINIRRSPGTKSETEPTPPSPRRARSSGGQDKSDRTEITWQESNGQFRRTHIRRSRASIENVGVQMAMQALEMRAPEISVYPNPSQKHCPSCAYRRPCIAMSTGLDPAPILTTDYRKRSEEELAEERLPWSIARGRTPAALGSVGWRSQPGR